MATYQIRHPVTFAVGDGVTKTFPLKNKFTYPVSLAVPTAVYVAGVQVLTVTSDGTNVTFATAPASGAALSWTGSYVSIVGYFPSEVIPWPVRDNYASQYGVPFKRTVMDDGHGRYRRQWESQPVAETLNWQMSWNQLTTFEGFLKFDCAQASGFFTLQLHPNGPLHSYRMTKYPDISFDDTNGYWQVSASVEYIKAGPTGYAKPATLPTFPTTLPQPEKSGYSIARDNTVSRSNQSGSGYDTQRARWTDETGVFNVTWLLDRAQKDIWDNFVHNQLLGGLAPFLGWFANGKGIVTTRVKFVDTPQITSSGAAFTVSAQCELQQIPGLTYADYIGDAITLGDSTTFSEAVSFKISRAPFADSITYADTISFRINRPISDSLTYTETTSITHTGYNTLGDSLTTTETIAFTMKPAPLADSVAFSVTGGIVQQDYVTGYVQFGYVGKTTAFVN